MGRERRTGLVLEVVRAAARETILLHQTSSQSGKPAEVWPGWSDLGRYKRETGAPDGRRGGQSVDGIVKRQSRSTVVNAVGERSVPRIPTIRPGILTSRFQKEDVPL